MKKEGEHPTFESKSLSISPLSLLLSLNDSYLFGSIGCPGEFLCYSSAIIACYSRIRAFVSVVKVPKRLGSNPG